MKANVIFRYKGFTAKLYYNPDWGNDYPYHGHINCPPVGEKSTEFIAFSGETIEKALKEFEEKIDKWLLDNNVQPAKEGF